jgi:prepilin-type N-terminal cleavage/methylation domain-containing protein
MLGATDATVLVPRGLTMPFPRARHGRCGFTLFEVLVTLAILSVGIVLVLSAMSASTAALDESRDVLRMQLLARDLLDRSCAAMSQPGGALPEASGQYRAPFENYRWNLDVAPVLGGGAGSQVLSRVSAAVWRDGTSRRCVVETYLCGLGGSP